MRELWRRGAALALTVLTAGCASSGQAVSFPSNNAPLNGTLYVPQGSGAHPAIVVLHRSSGLSPAIQSYAQELSRKGYVALALDYYSQQPSPARPAGAPPAWPLYRRHVIDAVTYLNSQPRVSSGKIGLIGFSMGATLALAVVCDVPDVKALVLNYATVPGGPRIDCLPPTLIFHGGADAIAPVGGARRLADSLERLKKPVDLRIYPGARHAFGDWSGPGIGGPGGDYDGRYADDAWRRTLAFLAAHLTPPR